MVRFRFWLLLQAEPVGAAIGLTIAGVLLVALSSLFWTAGRVEPLEGRLVGWRLAESETGSYRLAHVQAGDRTFTVRIPVRHPCRVGDRVALQRWRLWWGGSMINAARSPCPERTRSRPSRVSGDAQPTSPASPDALGVRP